MSYKVILDMLFKKILANINFEPTELAFSKDDTIVLNVFDDICFKKVFDHEFENKSEEKYF